MRRLYIVCAFLIALTFSLTAEAQYKAGYYSKMDGKKKEALKQAAKECVQKHTTLVYYDLPNYWQYTDVYPQLVNGCKRWWDMYSDVQYLIQKGQTGVKSFSANKMQREHSVPKSWWKKNGDVEYTPAYSDMWNLYPSDGPANQAKLNYPLGVTKTQSFNNGVTKVGGAATGYGGGSANVFEPADEYKGDFARAYMYMATVYDDINWVVNYMYRKEEYPTLVPWATNMLLQWCRQDPVDQKEIDRNNTVEQYQGNRNPFVDFPELAEYIWGLRTNEVFRIADQEEVNPTPPITGDPEISMPVNGEALDFGQTAVGTSVGRVLQIVGKNLTSSLTVKVVGADKANFQTSVTSIPAATINQNQGYLLNIVYTPTSAGVHEAKATLYDGGISGSIAVTLKGEALERPSFTTLTALQPIDLKVEGYTACWNPVPSGEIADYYLLTRVRYVDGNEETETYETGETSYSVSGREPGVAESYYVQYSRLGLLSEPSNVIYVAADAGVNDIERGAPVKIFIVENGIQLRVDGEANPIQIFDINGIEIMRIDNPEDGAVYSLPQGIFIARSEGLVPQKIVL